MLGKKRPKRILEYCGNDALEPDYVIEEERRPFSTYRFGAIQDKFTHSLGKFMGYYARRRMVDGYEWYGGDKSWYPLSPDMQPLMLLKPKESADQLFLNFYGTITLVAQWEDEKGERLNLGYRMFTNTLMGHAFGGMEGKTYHNTREAFFHGIRNGYQYMEVDLSLTSDDRLVLCHGWTPSNCKCLDIPYEESFKEMTYERIMGMKVHGNPIMDAREFYGLLKEYPDICYEIDFHSVKGEDAKKRIRIMLEDFSYDEQVINRLLIQAYNEKMYEDMQGVYPFRYYQYIVGNKMDKLDKIITYALDHRICALGLRANLAKPELVRKIRNAGLYVMCYTIEQDVEAAQKLLDSGVNTLCTDFITETMLRENKKRMGRHRFFVYYNSSREDARAVEGCLDAKTMVQTPGHTWEYKDSVPWDNDGKRELRPCMFEAPGMEFTGWHLRVKIDGKQYWYGKDHMYHIRADWENCEEKSPYLFADREVIPIWTLKQDMKLVMCAQWRAEDNKVMQEI